MAFNLISTFSLYSRVVCVYIWDAIYFRRVANCQISIKPLENTRQFCCKMFCLTNLTTISTFFVHFTVADRLTKLLRLHDVLIRAVSRFNSFARTHYMKYIALIAAFTNVF